MKIHWKALRSSSTQSSILLKLNTKERIHGVKIKSTWLFRSTMLALIGVISKSWTLPPSSSLKMSSNGSNTVAWFGPKMIRVSFIKGMMLQKLSKVTKPLVKKLKSLHSKRSTITSSAIIKIRMYWSTTLTKTLTTIMAWTSPTMEKYWYYQQWRELTRSI